MIYDLAVVGAGPAGSSAAIVASRAGLSALLLERKGPGRDKYCGGGITVLARRYLKECGAREVEETFEVYCEGHVLVLPDERLLIDSIKGVDYAMVRRSVFDRKLMEIAESCGAEFKRNVEIVRVDPQEDHVVLKDNKGGEYKARYVILATGMREKLLFDLGFSRLRPKEMGHCWGTEAPYNVKEQVEKWKDKFGFTPIFLMFGVVTYGYFWVFPKASHMNVGMGTTLEESMKYGKLHAEGYRRGLQIAKELGILDNTSPFKVDRGWILPAMHREKTYSPEKRVVLVGDAAGFVHPLTGEGISSAVCSGKLASQVVKKAVDYEDPNLLAEYEKLWWKEFGEELFVYGVKLAKLFYSSPLLLELGLKGVMEDEKATKLLSALLYRSDPRAGEKFYKYIVKRLPLIAIKALKAGKVRSYAEI